MKEFITGQSVFCIWIDSISRETFKEYSSNPSGYIRVNKRTGLLWAPENVHPTLKDAQIELAARKLREQ